MNLAKKKILIYIQNNRKLVAQHSGLHELLLDINQGCNSNADLTESQLDFLIENCINISEAVGNRELSEKKYEFAMARLALINYVNNCK